MVEVRNSCLEAQASAYLDNWSTIKQVQLIPTCCVLVIINAESLNTVRLHFNKRFSDFTAGRMFPHFPETKAYIKEKAVDGGNKEGDGIDTTIRHGERDVRM